MFGDNEEESNKDVGYERPANYQVGDVSNYNDGDFSQVGSYHSDNYDYSQFAAFPDANYGHSQYIPDLNDPYVGENILDLNVPYGGNDNVGGVGFGGDVGDNNGQEGSGDGFGADW